MSSTKVVSDVVKYIQMQNNNGDEDIGLKFPNLTFGQCTEIDKMLYPEKNIGGGYWRNAYNYPKEGDIIAGDTISGNSPPETEMADDMIAVNVGFFTFQMVKKSD